MRNIHMDVIFHIKWNFTEYKTIHTRYKIESNIQPYLINENIHTFSGIDYDKFINCSKSDNFISKLILRLQVNSFPI